MELGLKGRVAVITGGSRGIGRAIGRALAAEGVDLVLLARGQEALDTAADDIRREFGARVLTASADISRAESVKAAAEAVRSQVQTVHIVVINAGGPIRRMDRQITWPDTDWVDDINLKAIGMLRVVQAFVTLMPRDGS